jgi:hypothetical protein
LNALKVAGANGRTVVVMSGDQGGEFHHRAFRSSVRRDPNDSNDSIYAIFFKPRSSLVAAGEEPS